ncbi:glycosyl hydrolase family 8 [Sporocytophaga myxococcoides]|uniref:glycosyl hydrolase family 8 n=1 Tax=Sporocytophaga myxococcoides TaxID=153721 RepID=UPI0003FE349F|nr:glycosyl hydrolase family 8 [Sporocytophaga myxococcoides]
MRYPKIEKIFSVFAVIILTFNLSQAQINTPSGATKPFGSNSSYEYGLLPANLPSTGSYGKASEIASIYNQWKTDYVENCGNDKARVKWDDQSKTVSEGIGYGMLLAAYAADQDLFNRLWAYYKQFRNSHGVMHWRINGCNSVSDQNGATDAELDAAMALIVANYQWPNSTSPHNYKTDAVALIKAIKDWEINKSDGTFENGDMWKPACRNPSYQAPGYARIFKVFMAENGNADNSFWDNVVAKTEGLLINNAHSSSGLATNWCTPAGPPSGSCSGSGTAPDKFGFDACRAPWRQATNYIWFGSSGMQTIINRQADLWIGKGGAGTVQGGDNMNHDGSGSGYHNSAFVGMVGAMSLGASNTTNHQNFCNAMYSENKNNSLAPNYFSKILQMIGLFVQTGNFWNPYQAGGTTNNSPSVSLTSPSGDISACQGTSVSLVANATDSDGTISKVEFYNGTTLIATVTSSPYSYSWTNAPVGSLTVTAKAYDDDNAVTTSASRTITVTALPAAPGVTASLSYCLGGTASALSATGTSLKWYTEATGGTASTTAPTPSTSTAGSKMYYVSQTTSGCESSRATITVNVSQPAAPTVTSPVNYCQGATASALTATGTSLKWYTDATGGNAATTAPTPSTSTTGSKIYYVSQTTSGCESSRASITVTVSQAPLAPAVTSSVSYCQGASASALTATGTSLKWYTESTGGTSSTTAPVPSTTTAGTQNYYVSQASGGCESPRSTITVTVIQSSAPVVTSSVSYCLGATASALTATGTSLRWYTLPTGGTSSTTAPTPSTSTAGTQSYYVSQTSGNCESPRALITVTVNQTAVPAVTSQVNYCQGASAAQLTATGTSLKWYLAATNGTSSTTAPTPTTTSTGTQNYWVTQTLNSCESSRAQITVSVGAATTAPTVTSPVSYCQGAASTALSASGTNLKWYTSSAGGTATTVAPVPSTQVSGNTSYFVSQTGNGCESARTEIKVTIKAAPAAPSVQSPVIYGLSEVATPLSASGTSLKWYTTQTAGTSSSVAPTPSTSVEGTITYYVSQTNAEGCESPRSAIVVNVLDLLPVYRTATAPVIDGEEDNIWSNIGEKNISKVILPTVSSPADLSGTFKVLWNDQYFYLLADITDDVKTSDSDPVYEDDGIELFFDIGNNKPSTYGNNDVQYTFKWNGTTVSSNPEGRSVTGINYSMKATTNGYVFEVRIPWSTLQASPLVGQLHGIDIHVNDDDNGGARDGKISWAAISDDAWQNPSLLGTMILKEMPVIAGISNGSISGLKYYPNPFNNFVEIEGLSEEVSYSLINVNGQTVQSGKTTGKINTDCIPGVYSLILNLESGNQCIKLVKID